MLWEITYQWVGTDDSAQFIIRITVKKQLNNDIENAQLFICHFKCDDKATSSTYHGMCDKSQSDKTDFFFFFFWSKSVVELLRCIHATQHCATAF